MIELLVAVVILIIIMLAFGMIITTIQGTVSTGQEAMRSNAAAAAIIDTLRSELRQITQHGLLCITQTDTADGYKPLLTFTTAGVIAGKTGNASANGGLVSIGICENQSGAGSFDVLFARNWLLASMSTVPDAMPWDLAHIQKSDRDTLNGYVVEQYCAIPPDDVRIPAGDLDDVNALWQVLADGCDWISILWTDGDTDTEGLKWYGIDYNQDSEAYEAVSVGSTGDEWVNVSFDSASVTQIEYDAGTGGDDLYRALWTHHNQNNWPRAIKIAFKLTDHDSPYELICPIGG